VKISATIITFNEEKNIRRAIESIQWADEIIVVDSESTDKTPKIAESLGAKVITQNWLGFSKQKQLAVDNATNDWIFSLDADEKVSEKLKAKILQIKSLPENEKVDGYKIPRLSFYMNRPIRHSGWYPDRQLRFFNRSKGKWKDVLIHESVQMSESAKVEILKEDIYHFSVENAAQHHKMIGERYAPMSAEQMFRNGKTTTPFKIYTSGFTTFIQTYILKGGFLDGLPGFAIARFAAHHAFLKHLLLWEKLQSVNSRDLISKSVD
jgi:glycosyltransferase involved in cell wall biosynthesis